MNILLPKFECIKPNNEKELFDLMYKYTGRKVGILAGGTDLLPTIHAGKLTIDYMIDISSLGLNEIIEKDGAVHIGSMVNFRQLTLNKLIQDKLPALLKAAKTVGAVQTRSLATIGGNICSAVPSCDSAPALIALGAKLLLNSSNGHRIINIEDFFKGPRKNALNSGEILYEIIIPLPNNYSQADFIKYGRRKALTLAKVNGASMLELDNEKKVIACRIALGAVAPTPIRAVKAEDFLIGKEINSEIIDEASKIALSEISPISDIRSSADYRLQMSKVIVKRTLSNVYDLLVKEII